MRGVLAGLVALLVIAADGAAQALDAESILGHVRVLAADSLGGRGAGSEGYRQAADYSAAAFRRFGAQPAGNEGGYLQAFTVGREGSTALDAVNVLAFVEGSDPRLGEEVVSVGAHLDGLGIRNGVIHNGANDNATGSAVVLELARALAADPPRRSVLLALWGAEEIGMHGSRYQVAHPTVDMTKMVAHVNLDGIGRYDRSPGDTVRIYALGAENICAALGTELRSAASTVGVELRSDDPNGWFRFSDHYNFHLAGIPSVFLTDLGSDDYHKPTDDTEAIDGAKLARAGMLGLELVRALADREDRVCPSSSRSP